MKTKIFKKGGWLWFKISVFHTKMSSASHYYGDQRYGNYNNLKFHWYGLFEGLAILILRKLWKNFQI